MKVYIDTDERYPDYLLTDKPQRFYSPTEVDVDEATAQRWFAAVAEYDRVQDEMEAAFKAAQ